MRIVIDSSAANDPDAHEWLDRTLYRIEDRWHIWDLTDTPDLGALQATAWIGGRGALGDRVRELLVRSTQRGAWTPDLHGRRVRVTAHPAAADDLAPEVAFRLADEPLVILVENRESDGPFVERVLKDSTSPWVSSGSAEASRSDSTASVAPARCRGRSQDEHAHCRVARGSSPS